MSERLLTLEEVCQKLGGVKPWTIRCWVSQQRIPYTKVGRLTRFPENRIKEWMRRNTVLPRVEEQPTDGVGADRTSGLGIRIMVGASDGNLSQRK